jgi:hypothetical protein
MMIFQCILINFTSQQQLQPCSTLSPKSGRIFNKNICIQSIGRWLGDDSMGLLWQWGDVYSGYLGHSNHIAIAIVIGLLFFIIFTL